MTEDEFQKQYHHWTTSSEIEARAEADKVNATLIVSKNGPVFPVNFGDLGWGLMLKVPYRLLVDSNIL